MFVWWLLDCLLGEFICSLVGSLVELLGWLVGWLVVLSFCFFAGWVVVLLVGWLVI